MSKKRTILIIILFLTIFVGLFPKIIEVHADTWYNYSWNYRKSHVILASAGTATGYQIKITCKYGSGTDSIGIVYLNSHSQTDFDDIRFTDDDKTTLLDYWLESKIDSTTALFWVEVKDTLISDTIIYIYYGNSAVSSISNGNDTFIFFEHFTSASETLSISGAGTFVRDTANSQMQWQSASGNAHATFNSNLTNVATRSRMKFTNNLVFTGLTSRFGDENNWYHSLIKSYYSKFALEKYVASSYASIGEVAFSSTINTWYIMDFGLFGSGTGNLNGWADSTNNIQSNNQLTTQTKQGLAVYYTTTGQSAYWDWLLLRQYVNPEPIHSIWGNEIFHSSTTLYYTSNGVAYLSGTDGTTFSAITNGSSYYMGNYVLTLYALPSSNKTFINMIVNGTTYKTSNPSTVSGIFNTTVWICFGLGASILTGNATIDNVLLGYSFYSDDPNNIFIGIYEPPQDTFPIGIGAGIAIGIIVGMIMGKRD
jgi:hypothetical protein